jgi:hypothetical protein
VTHPEPDTGWTPPDAPGRSAPPAVPAQVPAWPPPGYPVVLPSGPPGPPVPAPRTRAPALVPVLIAAGLLLVAIVIAVGFTATRGPTGAQGRAADRAAPATATTLTPEQEAELQFLRKINGPPGFGLSHPPTWEGPLVEASYSATCTHGECPVGPDPVHALASWASGLGVAGDFTMAKLPRCLPQTSCTATITDNGLAARLTAWLHTGVSDPTAVHPDDELYVVQVTVRRG